MKNALDDYDLSLPLCLMKTAINTVPRVFIRKLVMKGISGETFS